MATVEPLCDTLTRGFMCSLRAGHSGPHSEWPANASGVPQRSEQRPEPVSGAGEAAQGAVAGAGLNRLVGTVLTVCPPESLEFEAEHVWDDDGDRCVNCGVGSAWLNILADAVRRAAEAALAAARSEAMAEAAAIVREAGKSKPAWMPPRRVMTMEDLAAHLERMGAAPAGAAVPVSRLAELVAKWRKDAEEAGISASSWDSASSWEDGMNNAANELEAALGADKERSADGTAQEAGDGS